ncbi:MAG: hypothetical protein O3C40_37525, partial [Planctomycetota bacterium]|nr:hypothetical protein [Planctomycetota bacterium]
KLSELLQYNLKSVRSHLMKEEFQIFWTYTYPAWAVSARDKHSGRRAYPEGYLFVYPDGGMI